MCLEPPWYGPSFPLFILLFVEVGCCCCGSGALVVEASFVVWLLLRGVDPSVPGPAVHRFCWRPPPSLLWAELEVFVVVRYRLGSLRFASVVSLLGQRGMPFSLFYLFRFLFNLGGDAVVLTFCQLILIWLLDCAGDVGFFVLQFAAPDTGAGAESFMPNLKHAPL